MEREKARRGASSAAAGAASSSAFNTDEVMDLLARFEASSLSEMRLRNGEVELLFRRGMPGPVQVATPQYLPVHAGVAPQPSVAGGAAAPAPSEAAKPASNLESVTSPIVGTFYRSAAPDAPPFVEVGSRVKKGNTLCILEAMKLMNQLEAEFDCEIVTILVENGKMVEFGTPIFEVRRV
jgi:acetyl-CoA carboxylase biotin carboxyl carrier protein